MSPHSLKAIAISEPVLSGGATRSTWNAGSILNRPAVAPSAPCTFVPQGMARPNSPRLRAVGHERSSSSGLNQLENSCRVTFQRAIGGVRDIGVPHLPHRDAGHQSGRAAFECSPPSRRSRCGRWPGSG